MESAVARAQITEGDDSHHGWRAALELGFERRDERSVCHRRRHFGPLRIQRPFYPEGDGVCHVYMLHPPGGVVGGDELDVVIDVGETAAALLTTPAAGKFYRSAGPVALLRQTLRVTAGAILEWLPQETIVFAGARVNTTTQVILHGDARFVGWEITCLGRPGAGERFTAGVLSQAWEIHCDGKPLFIERAVYDASGSALNAAWGLADLPVCGSMVCVGDFSSVTDEINEGVLVLNIDGQFSVTQLANVLVCRYLGRHSDEAKNCFVRAWEILRPHLAQRKVCTPRIWAT